MDDHEVRQQPGYKPPSEWMHLGDYFASVRAADIVKARQQYERGAIRQLVVDGWISVDEETDALLHSSDLAVTLRELQARVAARQRQSGNGG